MNRYFHARWNDGDALPETASLPSRSQRAVLPVLIGLAVIPFSCPLVQAQNYTTTIDVKGVSRTLSAHETVDVFGNGSPAIRVREGGVLTVEGSPYIVSHGNTVGTSLAAALIVTDSQATVRNVARIESTGLARAIYLRNDNGLASRLVLSDSTVLAQQSSGVWAEILEQHARTNDVHLTLARTRLETFFADNAHGVVATHGAQINMSDSTVITHGNNAAGVFSAPLRNDVFMEGGSLIAFTGINHISTYGQGASGLRVRLSEMNLASGTANIVIHGNSDGLSLWNNFALVSENHLSPTTFTSEIGSILNITSAVNSGARGINIEAGTVNLNGNATINTSGTGILVDTRLHLHGTVLSEGSLLTGPSSVLTIATTDADAYGLYAVNSTARNTKSTITLGGATDLSTLGNAAIGALANGAGSQIDFQQSPHIRTEGEDAHGVLSTNGAHIQFLGGTADIRTQKPSAWGGVAENDSLLLFDHASSGGASLWARFGGRIALSGTADASGSRIKLTSGGTLELASHDSQATIGSLEGDLTSLVTIGQQGLKLGANTANHDGSLVDMANYQGRFLGAGALIKEGAFTQILSALGTSVSEVQLQTGGLKFTQNGPFRTTGDYTNTLGTTTLAAEKASLIIGGTFTQSAAGTLDVMLGSSLDIVAHEALLGGHLIVRGFGERETPIKSSQIDRQNYLFMRTQNGIFGDFKNITTERRLQSSPDYVISTGYKDNFDKDYRLGFQMAWTAEDLDDRSGTFTLSEGTAFEVDTPLFDISATNWNGKDLTKNGPGTLILSGDLSYTGTSYLNEGTLILDAYLGKAKWAGNIQQTGNTHAKLRLLNGAVLTGKIDPVDIEIDGKSSWQMTDASAVGRAILAGKILYHPPQSASLGKTLTATDWEGQHGSVTLYALLDEGQTASDQIILERGSATGLTFLHVQNVGGIGGKTIGDGIKVIAAKNGATSTNTAFALPTGSLTAGLYQYELYKGSLQNALDPHSWFLRSFGYRNELYLKAATPQQALFWNSELVGSLHERVGNTPIKKGWGRLVRRTHHATPTLGKIEGSYDFIQVGAPLFSKETADATDTQVGLYTALGEAKHKVTREIGKKAGLFDLQNYAIGANLTLYGKNDWYSDTLAQVAYHKAIFNPSDAQTSKAKAHGFLFSEEIGWTFRQANGTLFEPQAQVHYQSLRFRSNAQTDLPLLWDNTQSLTLRLGARLARTWQTKTNTQMSVWLTPSLVYEFLGETRLRFPTISQGKNTIESTMQGMRLKLVAGLEGDFNPAWHIFGAVSSEHAFPLQSHAYGWQLGLRHTF